MAVHAGICGVFLDSLAVDGDGLPVFSQIGVATAEPDDGVRVVGVALVPGSRRGQLPLAFFAHLGAQLRRIERCAGQR